MMVRCTLIGAVLVAPAWATLRASLHASNGTAASAASNDTVANSTLKKLADVALAVYLKNSSADMSNELPDGAQPVTDILMPVAKVKTDTATSDDLLKVFAAAGSSQTAETASKNHALITASDVANLYGGFRGEEMGAAGGKAVEGDMIFDESQTNFLMRVNATGKASYREVFQFWTGGVMKYCFAGDIHPSTKYLFEVGARQIEKAVPCLKFENVGWMEGTSSTNASEQLCKESPAVFVTSDSTFGCSSFVGMLPTRRSQMLQLNPTGCLAIGTVVHEILHSLGVLHEQSRPDRDQYVRILWENIMDGMGFNFDLSEYAYADQPYDYKSVMHYDAYEFSKGILYGKTIERIDGKQETIGQRVGLSDTDIRQLANMYGELGLMCTTSAREEHMGCVDAPTHDGEKATCPVTNGSFTESFCATSQFKPCCACGGGLSVQCYEGDTGCRAAQSTGVVQRHWPFVLFLLAVVVAVCGPFIRSIFEIV